MRYLLIKSKKDDTPLLSVQEGQQYRLPTGFTIKDVKIEVWQEKPEISAILLPNTQNCNRCGNLAKWQNSCCSERAAGFKGKWVCSTCKFIGYVRA